VLSCSNALRECQFFVVVYVGTNRTMQFVLHWDQNFLHFLWYRCDCIHSSKYSVSVTGTDFVSVYVIRWQVNKPYKRQWESKFIEEENKISSEQDRLCMYKCVLEARSRNQFCNGKVISIKRIEYVTFWPKKWRNMMHGVYNVQILNVWMICEFPACKAYALCFFPHIVS
jgi:hypothetical protein